YQDLRLSSTANYLSSTPEQSGIATREEFCAAAWSAGAPLSLSPLALVAPPPRLHSAALRTVASVFGHLLRSRTSVHVRAQRSLPNTLSGSLCFYCNGRCHSVDSFIDR